MPVWVRSGEGSDGLRRLETPSLTRRGLSRERERRSLRRPPLPPSPRRGRELNPSSIWRRPAGFAFPRASLLAALAPSAAGKLTVLVAHLHLRGALPALDAGLARKVCGIAAAPPARAGWSAALLATGHPRLIGPLRIGG